VSGSLVLIATPIGNLGDVSQRSRDALAAADLIACEDSRHSGRLVKHLGIADPTYVVVNEHTERDACARIVDAVAAGKTVALITDAGTPAISDPGSVVVRAVLDAGLSVSAVPGPAALVMALVVSGLPTTRFVFEGFIPRSGGDRDRRLADIALEERTTIIYESPHRVVRTLTDLATACGGHRRVAVARELTKMHESVYRGRLEELAQRAADEPAFERGEITLVIAGAVVETTGEGGAAMSAAIAAEEVMERVLRAALAHLPAAKAAAIAAAASGLGRDAAYARAVELAAARR